MSTTTTAAITADSTVEGRSSSSQRLLAQALQQKQAKQADSASWVSNIQRIGNKSHTYVCFSGGKLKTFTTDKEDLNTTVALLFGHLNGLATRGAVAAGLAAVLTQSLLAPAFALDPNALPTGYVSVSGNHTFTQNGNVLDVSTGSVRSIVNYNTFNVGSNATVNFNLPSASSSILNRVVSGQLSQIYGNINSNGRVFLVNPGGVVFGGSSVINVGGLVASTLNINNAEFLAGRYNFFRSATDAMGKITVENGAQLNAAQGGSLSLLASQIAQAGALTASGGTINLGVGERITLGDDLIGLTVTEGVKEAVEGASLLNSGTLSAQRVQIVADGLKNALLDAIVNNSGRISANALVEGDGGTIELIAKGGDVVNSGNLIASSQTGKGGTVHVLGDETVSLLATSEIDASGATGGGTVLVGGNYLGQDASIQNAKNTVVENGATINVSATNNGNGGKAIVWADNATFFDGRIEAKGGTQSGNGGFVETSGKEYLSVDLGLVDASASNGVGGTWLMDPRNVTITDNNTTNGYSATYNASSNNSNVKASSIESSLNAGTNVTITTGTTGSQDGDITVAVNITKSSGANAATLTLNAADEIYVDSSIIGNAGIGALNVVLNADYDITSGVNTPTRNGLGDVYFRTASSMINTNGLGDVTITGNDIYIDSSPTSSPSTPAAIFGKNVTLDTSTHAGGDDIYINRGILASQNIVVKANDDVTFNDLTSTRGQLFSQNGTIAVTAGIKAGTTGAITLNSMAFTPASGTPQAGVTSVIQTNNQNVTLTGKQLIVNANSLSPATKMVNAGTGTLAIQTTDSRGIQVGGAAADGVATLGVSANELGRLAAGTVNIGQTTTGTGLSITGDLNAGTLGYNLGLNNLGDITTSANRIFTLGAKTINLNSGGAINLGLGGASAITNASAVGDITLTATGNNITTGNLNSTGGDVILNNTGNGNIVVAGSVIADDLNITMGSGTTTLDNAANDVRSLVLTTANGNASFVDVDGFEVFSADVGTGKLTLKGGDEIYQFSAIKAGELDVTTTAGAITLANDLNDVDTVKLSTSNANASFADADGFDVAKGDVGTGWLTLKGGGAITQSAAITAKDLHVTTTAGTVTLENAANDVDSVALTTANANASYVDADGFEVFSGDVGTGKLTLKGGDEIYQFDAIKAGDLDVSTTAGAITLEHAANDVRSLVLTTANGNASFVDADGFEVFSADVGTGKLTLKGGEEIYQFSAIKAGELDVTTTAGAITLEHAANDVDTLKLTTTNANASFSDADGFDVAKGDVGTGWLTLKGGGAITQSAAITAKDLHVTTTAGAITLENIANDVDSVALTTTNSDASYVDADGFEVAGANVGTGNLTMKAGGSITQSGSITANKLSATATAGDITLTNADSTTATLTTNDGSITYTDKDGVTVTAVAGNGNVTLVAGGADVTADNAVAEISLDFVGASTGGIFSATANNLDLNVNTPATIIASNTVALSTTGNDAELTIDSEVSGSNGVTLQTNGRRSHIRLNDDSNINSKGGTVIVKTLADRNADITQVSGGTIDSDGNTELSTIGANSQITLGGQIDSGNDILITTTGENSDVIIQGTADLATNEQLVAMPSLVEQMVILEKPKAKGGNITIDTTGVDADVVLRGDLDASRTISVETRGEDADITQYKNSDVNADKNVVIRTFAKDSAIELDGDVNGDDLVRIATHGNDSDITLGENSTITNSTFSDVKRVMLGENADGKIIIRTTNKQSGITQLSGSEVNGEANVLIETTGNDADIEINGTVTSDNGNIDVLTEGQDSDITLGANSYLATYGNDGEMVAAAVYEGPTGSSGSSGYSGSTGSTGYSGSTGSTGATASLGNITIKTLGADSAIVQNAGSLVDASNDVTFKTTGDTSRIDQNGYIVADNNVTLLTEGNGSPITQGSSIGSSGSSGYSGYSGYSGASGYTTTVGTIEAGNTVDIRTKGTTSRGESGASGGYGGSGMSGMVYRVTTGVDSDITLNGYTEGTNGVTVATEGANSDITLISTAAIESDANVLVNTLASNATVDINGDITSYAGAIEVLTEGEYSTITLGESSDLVTGGYVEEETRVYGDGITVKTTGNYASINQNSGSYVAADSDVLIETTGYNAPIDVNGTVISDTGNIDVHTEGSYSGITLGSDSTLKTNGYGASGSSGGSGSSGASGLSHASREEVSARGDINVITEGFSSRILQEGGFGKGMLAKYRSEGSVVDASNNVTFKTQGDVSRIDQNGRIVADNNVTLLTEGDGSSINQGGSIGSIGSTGATGGTGSTGPTGITGPVIQGREPVNFFIAGGSIDAGNKVDIRTKGGSYTEKIKGDTRNGEASFDFPVAEFEAEVAHSDINLNGDTHGANGVTVTTENSDSSINIGEGATVTADDALIWFKSNLQDIQGLVNAGTESGQITLSGWDANTTLGLGGGTGLLNITQDEFNNLTARDIFFGDSQTNGLISLGLLDARAKAATDITFNTRFSIQETTPNSDSGAGRWNLRMANNRSVYYTGGATNADDRTTSAGIRFVGTNTQRFGDLDVELNGDGLLYAKLPDGLFSGKFLKVITPNGSAFVNIPGDDDGGEESNKLKNLAGNLRGRLGSQINNQFKGVTIPLNEDAVQNSQQFGGNPSGNAGLGGPLF